MIIEKIVSYYSFMPMFVCEKLHEIVYHLSQRKESNLVLKFYAKKIILEQNGIKDFCRPTL